MNGKNDVRRVESRAAVAAWFRAAANGQLHERPSVSLKFAPQLMGQFDTVLRDMPELLRDPEIDSLNAWVETDGHWERVTYSARPNAELSIATVRGACAELASSWERDPEGFEQAIALAWKSYAVGWVGMFLRMHLTEPARSAGEKVRASASVGGGTTSSVARLSDSDLVRIWAKSLAGNPGISPTRRANIISDRLKRDALGIGHSGKISGKTIRNRLKRLGKL